MALIRSRQSLGQRVLAPCVQSAQGPVCMTCGRLVDSEALVEGEPGKTTFAKVLVTHHGAEELRTFDMGSVEWDSYELKSHMMRANWFDPTSHEGLGLGVKIMPSDDDPAPIKVHSLGPRIVGIEGDGSIRRGAAIEAMLRDPSLMAKMRKQYPK